MRVVGKLKLVDVRGDLWVLGFSRWNEWLDMCIGMYLYSIGGSEYFSDGFRTKLRYKLIGDQSNALYDIT